LVSDCFWCSNWQIARKNFQKAGTILYLTEFINKADLLKENHGVDFGA
jgi:hypothetical protein